MDFCLKWRDHITNIEVLAVPRSPTQLYFLLQQRRLRWLGHVHRMAGGRIPKDLLYGQLAACSRSQRHFEKTQRLTFASRLSARLIWSTRAWYGLRKLGGTGQRPAPLEAWAQQRACQSQLRSKTLYEILGEVKFRRTAQEKCSHHKHTHTYRERKIVKLKIICEEISASVDKISHICNLH